MSLYRWISTMRTANSVTSLLVIDPLLPKDIGFFTCKTFSSVGMDMASFSLTHLIGSFHWSFGPSLWLLFDC